MRGMVQAGKLQTVGPFGVIAALAGAELGGRALAYWPDSALLWYLNLEVFRPLHYDVVALELQSFGDLAQLLCIAIPLLVLISLGMFANMRLALAIASNLSLVYSVLILYGIYFANTPIAERGVSLSSFWAPSCCLALAVLLCSLVSSAVSHRSYWREIFS